MRIDELIVQLARAAGPVRPLPGPSVRLAQWTAAAVPMMVLGLIVIGPRMDVMTVIYDPAFAGLAVATLGTAVLSAAAAFVLSVPGAERSAAADRAARSRRSVGACAGGLVGDGW